MSLQDQVFDIICKFPGIYASSIRDRLKPGIWFVAPRLALALLLLEWRGKINAVRGGWHTAYYRAEDGRGSSGWIHR